MRAAYVRLRAVGARGRCCFASAAKGMDRVGSRNPITLAGWDIEGVSVAGQETSVILPQIKVALDIGRCPNRAVAQPYLFITHGHMDHIGGVPFHAATRALMGMTPTQLYSIPEVCSAAQSLLDIHGQVGREVVPMNVHNLTVLAPANLDAKLHAHTLSNVGGEVTVRNDIVIRPFPTCHVIPSQGYLIVSKKKKLKQEYVGAAREVIIDAKKKGIEINDVQEVPEVAFTGDTTIDFVMDPANSPVLKAKVLIMECTFMDDTVDQEGAKGRGHMHVRDIAEHADCFENEAILLMHFSARYKAQYIEDQLDNMLPPALRQKVTPFFEGFSLR